MDNQEIINELGNRIIDLIEEYKDKLLPYEIGNQFISNAMSLMLFCAPNELIAIKTALSSINDGICDYQENHSNK